jgi:diacylglycerol kinase (ATP)
MQESPYKSKYGLQRVFNAVRYSFHGLVSVCVHEAAFQQELLLAALLIPTALTRPVSGSAKAMLVFSVMLILIVEVLNSAIEAVVDRVSFEEHPLAGRAKDMGSAAVMLTMANAAIVWSIVLGSP